MSETVHHKGTLEKIPNLDNLNPEQMAEMILTIKKIERDSYYDTHLEQLISDHYEQYYYHESSNTFYKLEDTETDPYDDVIIAHRVSNDIIKYECRFYNGGTYLGECLDTALDRLFKKEADEKLKDETIKRWKKTGLIKSSTPDKSKLRLLVSEELNKIVGDSDDLNELLMTSDLSISIMAGVIGNVLNELEDEDNGLPIAKSIQPTLMVE